MDQQYPDTEERYSPNPDYFCHICRRLECICDEPEAFDPKDNRYKWPEDRR